MHERTHVWLFMSQIIKTSCMKLHKGEILGFWKDMLHLSCYGDRKEKATYTYLHVVNNWLLAAHGTSKYMSVALESGARYTLGWYHCHFSSAVPDYRVFLLAKLSKPHETNRSVINI